MSILRVASFNANSIRSRLGIILDWIAQHNCDVLCVQETKVPDNEFPEQAIREAGLYCAYWGQRSYNGVAIISKQAPSDVVIGFGEDRFDEEARLIRAVFEGVTVVNTYVPQGTAVESPRFAFKLEWLRSLRDYFARDFSPDDSVVWAGDLNVAPLPIDVYDPEGLRGSVCFHPDEHEALNYAMSWGFVDVFRKHHPDEPYQYTFWDYRIPNAFKRRMGWRLDHILATRPLAEKSTACWIDTTPRTLVKPSDHTFIAADFQLD